jgi:hypothetical protein
VPILGLVERIAYRITGSDALGAEYPRLSLSQYRRFICAPVACDDCEIEFIVEGDVARFGAVIEHRHLLSRLPDGAAAEQLVALVRELSFEAGLPQALETTLALLDATLQYSNLCRTAPGRYSWRFNDDFRIACRSRGDAEVALRELAAGLEELGLALNPAKTAVVDVASYRRRWHWILGDDETRPASLAEVVDTASITGARETHLGMRRALGMLLRRADPAGLRLLPAAARYARPPFPT